MVQTRLASRRGYFITFEGLDGAGKSSLIKALTALLEKDHYTWITTREPGGSPVSEKIRELLLNQDMDPNTELFLYQAARAEHTHRTLLPQLHKVQFVLCDRFTDSTIAYQGEARGLSLSTILKLNTLATQGLKPDLTFFLDVDPQVSFGRAQDRNRFEAEGLEFQKKVRRGFLRAAKLKGKKWITLKAKNLSPEQLAVQVYKKIKDRLL